MLTAKNLTTLSAMFTALLAGVEALSQTAVEPEVTARPSRFTAAVDIGQRWHLDPSWGVFEGETRAPTAGVSLAMDVTNPAGRFVLGVEVGYTNESVNARLRQAFETRLSLNELRGALVGRWQLFSWMAPYARVGTGALHHDATISANDGSGSLVATGWAVEGFAGLGVMLQTGAIFRGAGWRSGRLTVSVEGGMMLASGVGLDVAPPTPEDEDVARDLLPVASTTVGSVNASSAYLRVSFGLRF